MHVAGLESPEGGDHVRTDQHLAARMQLLQIEVRIGDLFQRVEPRDQEREGAVLRELRESLEQLRAVGERFRVVPEEAQFRVTTICARAMATLRQPQLSRDRVTVLAEVVDERSDRSTGGLPDPVDDSVAVTHGFDAELT